MTKKLRVGVLFGGQSGEHEVSLVSARAVMEGLSRETYEIIPIGITKTGRWVTGSNPLAALEAAANPKLLPGGPRAPASDSSDIVLESAVAAQLALFDSHNALDVIFPVLHGPMGEDGTVQGMLTLAGIPYVGCAVLAAAVGMDKAMMKAAFAAAALPQVPWQLVRRIDWQRERERTITTITAQLHYPLFVKPANLGSSVGITRAEDRAALERGLEEAARYDRRIVVEQGIDAREIEVSVLGNDDVEASVPGEVVPSHEWYDYHAKYLGGESQIVIPAAIPPAIAEQARDIAIRAFKAIDGAGLARVDFLLDRATETLYLNEVNTMPGFTAISMYAKLWEASGLSYGKLLDRLIALALERHNHGTTEAA